MSKRPNSQVSFGCVAVIDKALLVELQRKAVHL